MAVGRQTGLDLWTHLGKKGKQIAVRDHLWLQVKWDEYKQAEETLEVVPRCYSCQYGVNSTVGPNAN